MASGRAGRPLHPLAGLSRRGLKLLLRGDRQPQLSGRLRVEGVRETLSVTRDRWGIPHVRARNDEDAWFGLGFCQGQDRPFQLGTLARVAKGRLSESLGPEGLACDRYVRRMGIPQGADALWAAQTDTTRASISAFAAGIEAGMREGRRGRGPAAALVRSAPPSFDAQTLMAIELLFAHATQVRWRRQWADAVVLAHDGESALSELRGAATEPLDLDSQRTALDGTLRVVAGKALLDLSEGFEALEAWVCVGQDFDSWALPPERCAEPRALVASAPLAPVALPSPWYLAHLSTPGWEAAGATRVGLAGIEVGHNERAAWGLTPGISDRSTFRLRNVAGGDEGASSKRGPAPRREQIFVKGATTEAVEVRVQGRSVRWRSGTASDERDEPGEFSSTAGHVELRVEGSWLEPFDLAPRLGLVSAKSEERMAELADAWPRGGPELVWADERRIAQRVATPGDGGAADSGVFTRSRRGAEHVELAPHVGLDWFEPERGERLEAALDRDETWDVYELLQVQRDAHSTIWPHLRGRFLELLADLPRLAELRRGLESWDGISSADSWAATFVSAAWARIETLVLESMIPASMSAVASRPAAARALVSTLRPQCRRQWATALARGSHPRPGERGANELRRLLSELHDELSSKHGASKSDWRWGLVAPLELRDWASRWVPRAAAVFDCGPFAVDGEGHAPPSVDPHGRRRIAGLRAVLDVGAWDQGRYCLPGGQSENPLSPHRDDLLPLWLRGQGVPIAFGDAAVERNAEHRLWLEPGAG